jgi:hypothetical protein
MERRRLLLATSNGGGGALITFYIYQVECQAVEGMTFYNWAMSDYYDSSCLLNLNGVGSNLREDIINGNVSSRDSYRIMYAGGAQIIPRIYTDTIIQPISYMPNFGGFD